MGRGASLSGGAALAPGGCMNSMICMDTTQLTVCLDAEGSRTHGRWRFRTSEPAGVAGEAPLQARSSCAPTLALGAGRVLSLFLTLL